MDVTKVYFEINDEERALIREIQEALRKDFGRVSQPQAIRRAIRIAAAQLRAEQQKAA